MEGGLIFTIGKMGGPGGRGTLLFPWWHWWLVWFQWFLPWVRLRLLLPRWSGLLLVLLPWRHHLLVSLLLWLVLPRRQWLLVTLVLWLRWLLLLPGGAGLLLRQWLFPRSLILLLLTLPPPSIPPPSIPPSTPLQFMNLCIHTALSPYRIILPSLINSSLINSQEHFHCLQQLHEFAVSI